MKVYLMTVNYNGWEDPEANGCVVEVYSTEEKALKRMEEEVRREIEVEKEYGREFYENARYPRYVSIVSQNSEYVEFEVGERNVL